MKRIVLVATIVYVVLALGSCGASMPKVDFTDYANTWQLIKQHHVKGDAKDMDLYYGSIRGMVAALHDPYSSFLDPDRAAFERQEYAEKFAGIGATVGAKEGRLVILAPIKGSPAEKAGLRTGDIIVKIDGVDATAMSVFDAVRLIRGKKGEAVTLTLYREGMTATFEKRLVRDDVVTESVTTKTVQVRGRTLSIVTIANFHEDTAEKVKEASVEAVTENHRGMIIDLRDDPGGLLDAAGEIACLWIPKGQPYMVMEKRGEKPGVFRCEGTDLLKNMPTIVLVNGGSASASEVVSGALQDHGKAKLVGEKTFGKGCGQDRAVFPDGSELWLTTFLWKTPKGRSIHDVGLMPDVEVKAPEASGEAVMTSDPQMERAIELLTR